MQVTLSSRAWPQCPVSLIVGYLRGELGALGVGLTALDGAIIHAIPWILLQPRQRCITISRNGRGMRDPQEENGPPTHEEVTAKTKLHQAVFSDKLQPLSNQCVALLPGGPRRATTPVPVACVPAPAGRWRRTPTSTLITF